MDSSSRQPRKWTLAEDQKLREEVEAQLVNGEVKDWCRIADQLPHRSNKDCRKRWHNSVQGGLKKGQWSKSEDQLLANGVEQYGQRWTLVANGVGSRSADQCAKRWQQSLDPELDRSEWREEEDRILIEATQRLGRHWKDISREHFPGRSKNCIKNRYTVLVRRYETRGIALPSAASSPSESNAHTPLSSYPDDDGYLSSNVYDDVSPYSRASSSENARSWSNMQSDAYPAWTSPQEYSMPTTMSGPPINHPTNLMPHYSYAQPHLDIPSASWNWATSQTNPATSMQARSHGPSPSMPSPSFYGYENYPVASQPMMNHHNNASYAHSPMGTAPYAPLSPRSPTNMPRAGGVARPRATSQQQDYSSYTPTDYRDSRHPHHSLYRF